MKSLKNLYARCILLEITLFILGIYSSIADSIILFFSETLVIIISRLLLHEILKKIEMECLISIVDLCRRKFCDGHKFAFAFIAYQQN